MKVENLALWFLVGVGVFLLVHIGVANWSALLSR